MKIEEIAKNPIYEIKDINEEKVVVYNKHFQTLTTFDLSLLERISKIDFDKYTHRGKNIEQITRVTGYFSKVNAWNKGKKAELKDRYRSNIN
jgi:hypothetical protein